MADRLLFLFQVWTAFIAGGLIHMLMAWVSLRCAGIGVPEFKVFYGKTLVNLRCGETSLMLGWIPLGMYVKWEEQQYPAASWRLRAGLPLLALVPVAVGSLLLLGWAPWVTQLNKSLAQIVQATIHPATVGAPLLETFYRFSAPVTVFFGLIWSKYVVFHLFPLAPLPGSAWWSEALRRPGNSNKPLEWIQTICGLTLALCWIPWATAWWHFVMAS